jgi:hypothetical protein
MSMACASCGAAMASADPACPSCGQARPGPRRAASSSSDDALQYVKIIGILVVAVVVVLIVAGMMGKGAQACGECNGKKVIVCVNCEDGRNKCRPCKGSGIDPGTHSTCADCGGKGATASCWKCQGKKKWNCPTCKGTGVHPG